MHDNIVPRALRATRHKKEILRQSAKQPLLWGRFIGDIFNLRDTNKEYIQVFIEKSNSYHATIKFTDKSPKMKQHSWTQQSITESDSRMKAFLMRTFTFQTN